MFKSRWFWVVTVFLLIVATIGVGATWAVNQYLSADGIARQLSSALDRDVTVESADFSLWSGVRLNHLEIASEEGEAPDPLLRARTLSLKPRWWPLLFGDVILDRATVTRPELQLTRLGEGEWNILRGIEQQPAPSPGSSVTEDTAGSDLKLEIQRISLDNGTIQFTDSLSGISEQVSFREIKIDDFSLARGAELSVDSLGGFGGVVSGGASISFSPLRAQLAETTIHWQSLSDLEGLLFAGKAPRPELQGNLELRVSKGTVRPDSVTLSARAKSHSGQIIWPDNVSAGWEQLTTGGKLAIEPDGSRLTWRGEGGEVTGGYYEGEQRIGAVGSLKSYVARYRPTASGSDWQLSGQTGDWAIDYPGLAESLNMRSEFMLDAGHLRASSFSGRLGSASISGRAQVALPYTGDSPILLGLSSSELDFQQVIPLLPAGWIPEAIRPRGRFSIQKLLVEGSSAQPRFEGIVDLTAASVQPPGLGVPIRVAEEELRLSHGSVSVESWTPRLGDESFQLSGSLQHRPRLDGRFHLKSEQLELDTVLASLDPRPSFPDTWQPSATLETEAELLVSPDGVSVDGNLQFPGLTVGDLKGKEGRAGFTYKDDRLTLSPLSMKLFGGEFNGVGTLEDLTDNPTFEADYSLNEIGVEAILTELSGVGTGSRGSLTMKGSLDGAISQLSAMSGQFDLGGDSLVLKNIPAVDNLDGAIIDGIAGVLGKEMGPLVGRLLGQSLGEQRQELRRVFTDDVVARWDRLRAALTVKEGKGTFDSTFLDNRYLRLSTKGNLWLDGRLNTTLSFQDKPPLTERARQDWLKDLLSAGLPPIRLKGTVLKPEYDLDAFQDEVLKTLGRMAVSDSPDGKQSVEDQLKQKLLQEIFD